MSVPCPLEVTFAPIAVTTHLAASTVPVQSMDTPWLPTDEAARVCCPYTDGAHCGCRLVSIYRNVFKSLLVFCTQILMNVWQERTHAQRIRAALISREDSDACPSTARTTTGVLETREYLNCVSVAHPVSEQGCIFNSFKCVVCAHSSMIINREA